MGLPENITVLVAEDMLTMRKLLCKELRQLGITRIVEALDGADAWSKILVSMESGTPIDMILTDWNMPKLRGIDLLKKVRSYDKMRDVPIIILTAESEKAEILDAIQSGVSGFVLKPFTFTILKEKLEFAWQEYEKKKQQAA